MTSTGNGSPAGSLRSRLEAKARRRVVVPIAVSDPGDAARRAAQEAADALAYGRLVGAKPPALKRLETAAAAAEAVLAEHTVDVELQAMASGDWEALVSANLLNGEDLDQAAMMPEALAGCSVDESLRSPDWWRERLADPAWTAGDVRTLWQAVITVNSWAPPAHLPKG